MMTDTEILILFSLLFRFDRRGGTKRLLSRRPDD
jgi:hypothetical protein